MKIFIISFFILLSFSSCLNYLGNKIGVKNKIPKVTEISYLDHKVSFIAMKHLGKQEFYDSVKSLISDFRNRGFVIYAESVSKEVNGEIITDTIYAKKLRSLLGVDITLTYDCMKNTIIDAMIEKFKLVGQPSYTNLGAVNYQIVDVPYADLIDLYEEKYGKVILDSCDLKTSLGNSFNCKLAPKAQREIFKSKYILEERNRVISETVRNSPYKKILLIYGADHLIGIKNFLERKNKQTDETLTCHNKF